MTIEQRVERMFNPGGSTPVGTGFPLVPFASLPDPLTVEGQIRRLAELPHVSLIALGGIWRPFGGRQVLAKRTINPVVVQDATAGGVLVETIGPFPGGLVRTGMTLDLKVRVSSGAISTSLRDWKLKINSNTFRQAQTAVNAAVLPGYIQGSIDVLSDANALHSPFMLAVSDYVIAVSNNGDFSADFSSDWSAGIYAKSADETAVAISSSSWSGGVATYNTSAVHTLAVGDKTTIAGVSLAGYNGVFIVASIVDTDTFTVAMPADPGGSGTGGTSSRISNMKSQSYVLELVG